MARLRRVVVLGEVEHQQLGHGYGRDLLHPPFDQAVHLVIHVRVMLLQPGYLYVHLPALLVGRHQLQHVHVGDDPRGRLLVHHDDGAYVIVRHQLHHLGHVAFHRGAYGGGVHQASHGDGEVDGVPGHPLCGPALSPLLAVVGHDILHAQHPSEPLLAINHGEGAHVQVAHYGPGLLHVVRLFDGQGGR